MASGGDDINAIDTVPKITAHVIYGAVIGGPDVNDKYFDIRSDWPETEVSLLFLSFNKSQLSDVHLGWAGLQCTTVDIGCVRRYAKRRRPVLHSASGWRLRHGQTFRPPL